MTPLAAGLLIAIAPLQGLPPASAPAPLPPEAYVSRLDGLASALRDAGPADAERISAGIAPRLLVAAGGEPAPVDMRWLVAALRAAPEDRDWPATRERILRRLQQLRWHAAEASEESASDSARSALRGSVTNVLARPEFNDRAGPTWREAIQQRIADGLASLLRGLGLTAVDGRRAAVALAWTAGLAALAGLGFWIARLLTSASATGAYRLAPAPQGPLTSREWARRALQALHAGDGREAVRCAYGSALSRLEEDGAWRVDRARTPREYLRMLRPGDRRGDPVRHLALLFERVWYGNHEVEPGEHARVSASLERLGCLQAGDRTI